MKKRLFTCLMTIALCLCLLPGGVLAETDPDWTGYTAISTPEQLSAMRNNPAGKYYLTQDIVFEEEDFEPGGTFYNDGKGWEPIAEFTGVLDGNGYAVVSLVSNGREQAAFMIHNRGTIQNLALFVSYFMGNMAAGIAVYNEGQLDLCGTYSCLIAGLNSCGGIAVCNTGVLINCYNDSTVVGSAEAMEAGGMAARATSSAVIGGCVNEGVVVADNWDSYVGGVVGRTFDAVTVEVCTNFGEIIGGNTGGIAGALTGESTLSVCANVGSFLGVYTMGGLVGATSGCVIRDSYNAGQGVRGEVCIAAGGILGEGRNTHLENCYNVGSLPAAAFVGGLVGNYDMAYDLTATNCYTVEGYMLIGDNLPFKKANQVGARTLEELQRQEIYVGFDFNEVWVMDDREGYTYPQLRQNIRIGYIECDVNGDGKTTVSDVRLVLRAAVGKITLTEEQAWIADINGDGNITVSDVRRVLRMAVGKESGTYYWAPEE